MCKVIAISNQKGGCGKTSVTANLGVGLAIAGKKVCLIDADPQGSLTISLGYPNPDEIPLTLATIMMTIIDENELPEDFGILHHKEGVDLIPANMELSGIGELLGLTWDCVDISDEAAAEGRACININKELRRVSKEALHELNGKDIILIFPEESPLCKTVRVLKVPKTETSIRRVFLPESVAAMLKEQKAEQDKLKEILGSQYMDYDLVMATSFGMPADGARLRKKLKQLIAENNLPEVVFHSIRHTSVTYKLKLNGGDIKSVQGDSGHAQVNMVTDVYSHIIDEDRRRNAQLFEEAFYQKKNLDPKIDAGISAGDNPLFGAQKTLTVPEGIDAEVFAKVLENPEMVTLLMSLAKAMEGR